MCFFFFCFFLDFSVGNSKISFQADVTFDDYTPVSLTIPGDSYPSGIYKYVIFGQTKSFESEGLGQALDQVISICEAKRTAVLEGLVTPSPNPKVVDQINQWDIENIKEIQKKIALDVAKVFQVDGWLAHGDTMGNDQYIVYLFLDPRKRLHISDVVADAWGIDLKKLIVVSLTFSGAYTESTIVPTLASFQSGRSGVSKLDGSELADKTKFSLSFSVENRLKKDWFTNNWPLKGNSSHEHENYLVSIMTMIENIIKNCPEHCIVCHSKLDYAGVKAVCCEQAICIFSYEFYGLGVDIESEIVKHPDIVDLMITLAYAACQVNTKGFCPFEPYPMMEVEITDKETGKKTKYDFKMSNENDASKVSNLLAKFPSVADMKRMVERGTLKSDLFELHPLAYSLLRWLVASNRCHLKRLEDKEMIKEMNTPYQYMMLSGTPTKEKKFQELKKKMGTYLGFHGSHLLNWHSILRRGLMNMSGLIFIPFFSLFPLSLYLISIYIYIKFIYIQVQKDN